MQEFFFLSSWSPYNYLSASVFSVADQVFVHTLGNYKNILTGLTGFTRYFFNPVNHLF